ncbi:hypothetical protein JTB14_000588 [Gonioctena quinquepunctata]|nr:hypothetical protein JTB14_000588 [Gonioctena quinquepunctata]
MSNFGFPFLFPAHEKAVWLEKLGLKEFTETVSKYARICSIHFGGEAFEIKPSGKIFLRKGARPLFFIEEYFPTTETASTSRLDNRKSSTDSTDTAPGTNCSDIIDSFGPPLKRFHSDTSATMTAPEIDTESLSETLTASETELFKCQSLKRKQTDPQFRKRKRDGGQVVAIYVDDLLVLGSEMKRVQEVEDVLKENFEVTCYGTPRLLLSIQISWFENRDTLCQKLYILKVFDKYKLSDCKPSPTPMDCGTKPQAARAEKLIK